MEIKIQVRDAVYSICIGRKTAWFEQTYFVSVVREWINDQKVEYATHIWHS